MRRALIALLLALGFISLAAGAGEAQVYNPQIRPSLLSSGACPSYSGATLSAFTGGMLCWRTDTLTLWVSNGDGTWTQQWGMGQTASSLSVSATSATATAATIVGATVSSAVVVGSTSSSFQVLGNDLVLTKTGTTVAPAGPGTGGAVLRLRASTVPGTCKLTVSGGNSFTEKTIVDGIDGGSLGC